MNLSPRVLFWAGLHWVLSLFLVFLGLLSAVGQNQTDGIGLLLLLLQAPIAAVYWVLARFSTQEDLNALIGPVYLLSSPFSSLGSMPFRNSGYIVK